tara:strand:+ start:104 stop:841 length:738 start_codon:yes stop_codon:yes gene_type:complete
MKNITDKKYNIKQINAVTKINSVVRTFLYKITNLPNSIKYAQKILLSQSINISELTNDGRINSNLDEDEIKKVLKKELKDRLYIPDDRHWYDISILDYQYGFLPINIKSTTTNTNDNIGNISILLYSLTEHKMRLNKSYYNGYASTHLLTYIKNNNFTKNYKRDYYFIVINKKNPKDIIINSIKGLNILTPNNNNLPYQINWSKNRDFKYKNINNIVDLIIKTIQKPKPSWQETFLKEIRELNID